YGSAMTRGAPDFAPFRTATYCRAGSFRRFRCSRLPALFAPPAGSPMSLAATSLPVPLRIGLWMIVTAVSFGAMVGTVRYLSAEMDVLVLSFWRNVFAALAVVPWLIGAGFGELKTRRIGLYTVRSAIFVASTVSLFMAVAVLPLAEATALSFTAPLFATVLAVWLLKENVTPARWAA